MLKTQVLLPQRLATNAAQPEMVRAHAYGMTAYVEFEQALHLHTQLVTQL